MIKNRRRAAGRDPTRRVTRGPSLSAESSPQENDGQTESDGELRQCGRMAERVGTVEYWRGNGAEATKHAPPREKISNERFAAWNELVGEHIPRAGLDRAAAQHRSEVVGAIGPNGQIVVDENRLAV